ncbi:flagellar filament capping protein FliD [Paenibacillus hamazuiensis]|uniref:flagellar filament capping protein FliD n=1 Tax=Paenibacillus hamazuiensis TaxID=2936508 RepID=UPI00200C28A0|nr:flagellar filament capping protein FliD [Paenibacillus hamazuiensis]
MVMRVGGLASGIDVDSIVSQYIKAQSAPLNKMKQTEQTLQWQKDDYRSINSKLYDFRNNKLSNYRLEGTFGAKTVDISGTNPSAISAATTGSALAGTMTIKVNRVATAASNGSTADIRTSTSFDPTAALSTQTSKINYNTADTTFYINGTKITFDPTKESLNDVIKKINSQTDVNASYDSTSGRVSFISKNTGLVNNPTDAASNGGANITFSGNFLTNTLNVKTGVAAAGNEHAAVTAAVEVNGLTQSTYNSNTITVNGVTITLKDTGTATLTVKTDTDKIVEAVKSFIADYNDTLKTLNDKLTEQRYKDFPPLTDEQKKDMKDSDIELWESKAKSGLLRNDSILSQTVNDMRMGVYSQVETGSDKYKTLASIGITTGDYSERGKLYLSDEQKLRNAIEADPEAIKALFTATGNGDSDTSDVGIAKRLYDGMQTAITSLTEKAGTAGTTGYYFDGSIIGKKLYSLATQIDAENDRINTLEDNYYRKFTAMEKAINGLNSQSSYLSQFLR